MEGQTKPWHREQYGIVQNLRRGRGVRGGKGGIQKTLGIGGNKDRELILQGQDFWGMGKMEEVTQEASEKNTQGAYKTCKNSQVLLGAQLIEATKSRQPLVTTSEHKPKL